MVTASHPPGSWWVPPAWREHKWSGGSLFLWQGREAGSDTAPAQSALLRLVCSPCTNTGQSRLWRHNLAWPNVFPLAFTYVGVFFTKDTLRCAYGKKHSGLITYTSQWMYSASPSRRCSSEKKAEAQNPWSICVDSNSNRIIKQPYLDRWAEGSTGSPPLH